MKSAAERISLETEICLRIANAPAALATVMAAAGSSGAEVLAFCCYWDRNGAVVLLVTDNPPETERMLALAGFRYTTNSVVLIGPEERPGRPGIAVQMGVELEQAGIGVLYSYTYQSEGNRACVVLRTTNDDRAVHLLKVTALIQEVATSRSRRGGGLEPELSEPVPSAQAA